MKASELLRNARSLVADERNWCQWATDKMVDGPKWAFGLIGRTARCSWGALLATRCNVVERAEAEWFLNEAAGELSGPYGFIDYNDRHSHAEVMVMWDRAIELAEAAEFWAAIGGAPVEAEHAEHVDRR